LIDKKLKTKISIFRQAVKILGLELEIVFMSIPIFTLDYCIFSNYLELR